MVAIRIISRTFLKPIKVLTVAAVLIFVCIIVNFYNWEVEHMKISNLRHHWNLKHVGLKNYPTELKNYARVDWHNYGKI